MSLGSNYSPQNNEKNNDGIKSKYRHLSHLNQNKLLLAKNYDNVSNVDYTGDPLKFINERNMSVYVTHLKTGQSGALEPNEVNYIMYEDLINKINSSIKIV